MLKKQTDIQNFTDLYCGYLQRFIDEYNFDFTPKAYLHGEEFDATDYVSVWTSDILLDENYNLYLPTYYEINNYEDNSYSDADTGHNLVHDVSYDTDAQYGTEYKIINFKDVVLPWILETMQDDDHPAYTEYVNVMTDKN